MIANEGRESINAAWGVTPQPQNRQIARLGLNRFTEVRPIQVCDARSGYARSTSAP
ncbi:hypothetical protein [Kribbella qitaiheensis]|uniref:hypothetical protein n=1 Tax=Kribbella qitaiheensis TaxID=1544730 RepID=UPI001FE4D853|nr:hypothetical protein [Kribbella qitaiheensis]